jgi:hydroxypyruvate isomerase
MSRLAQSASWWCFVPRFLSPETFVRSAAAIGYAAVELVPEQYYELVVSQGLTIASIAGHASIEAGLNRREHHARIVQELEQSLHAAAQWGIPNVICFSGSRDGLDDAEGAAITAEGLRMIAPLAEELGVTLTLELLNSKVDHPDYQADHTAWGVQVCELVHSPRVKLLYDIYHMQIMEGDIIRTIQTHHAHFAHYHTAGNPGRHELDEAQELNYAPILRAIVATGYRGYVGHEFVPTGDPMSALRAAFALGDLECG